jgi:hypothetical protein
MSDNINIINYDHNQSEAVGGFLPTRTTPRGRNLKHCDDVFFSLEKKQILDCQNRTNLNKFVEQMIKNIKIQSNIAFFDHFG